MGDRASRQFGLGWLLTGDDLKASNSFTAPAVSGGRTKFEIPAHSYAVLQWMM